MTRLQRLITHSVADHGYYLINTHEQKRTRQIVDAYMAHRPDLGYYWTGGYVAIAKTPEIAEIAVAWANNRSAVREYDNAPYWTQAALLKGAEMSTAWRLKQKEKEREADQTNKGPA